MKSLLFVCRAVALAYPLLTFGGAPEPSAPLLPGEDGTNAPLAQVTFRSRMNEFIWRNWFCIETARLAETVGARVGDVTAAAVEMGLPPAPVPEPEWRTKGYATVIRRNWHLLPYGQLLALLGWSREKLAYILMEDDFLFHKLGDLKPRCAPLRWSADEAAAGRAERLWAAATLREEGVDANAPAERRFGFMRELTRVDPDFKRPPAGDSAYDLKLQFSYFSDYADPLADDDVGSYPEGLLQRYAACGVNAVYLHVVLRMLAKDPFFTEFGEGAERRQRNLRTLVERAKKYGIRVFLYLNEPRPMPCAFFDNPKYAKCRGTLEWRGLTNAMCVQSPEVKRWLGDALETVFRAAPGLGGVYFICGSEGLVHCLAHGEKVVYENDPSGWCKPEKFCKTCEKLTFAESAVADCRAMMAGMRRADPRADAIVWDWGWAGEHRGGEFGPVRDILGLMKNDGVTFMTMSERGLERNFQGTVTQVDEYCLSQVGPSPAAAKKWAIAKGLGVKTMAKAQVSSSWEMAVVPYVPVMDNVARHSYNLMTSGVDSVMLSWTVGCYPAPNLKVFTGVRKTDRGYGDVLDRVAVGTYGAAAAPQVRAVWTTLSQAFAEYPFKNGTLHSGPHHWGPANPLYLAPSGHRATMTGLPYDDLDTWRTVFPAEVYVSQCRKVADGFARGAEEWRAVVARTTGAAHELAVRELGIIRTVSLHLASCADQSRFVLARRHGDRGEMALVARRELARAKELLRIAEGDSRIGYECTSHYFYTPQDLREKILNCRRVLAELEPTVPARHALKTINGRTYWSYCGIDDTSTNAVFRECACHFASAGVPPPGKAAWRTVIENYPPDYRGMYDTIEKRPHPFAPHVVRWNTKRNYRAFVGKVDLDVDDYRAFVKRHPEIHAFAMMDEWDNDMFMFAERAHLFKDPAERAAWVALWGETYATNRYEFVRLARQYRDRAVELYAGIDWMTRACRGSISIDHLAAAWGAKDIQVETTNTSSGDYEYRWDVAAPFIRGAARQFQIPWGWFVAIFLNGYARDGSWHVNNVCWYPKNDNPEMKPWCGVSANLERRAFYWAYVNGANYVEPEMAWSQFFDSGDGRKTLTNRGEAFVRFHDFTKAHPDRGATYAPVAILVPFARGYCAGGGRAWNILPYTVADHQTDGVFFTLIPGIHREELRKTKGMEFCLHNSKYAMMYDVVCPDAPQKPAELLKALEAYPAALLTGEYPNLETLSPTFMKYVESGGTLVVNRANIRAVRVPAKGGEPVRDGDGSVVATLHRVGRGRLFVSASDWMVKEFARKDAMKVVNATLAGDVAFPEIAAFLDRFQREYFPARVEGDCLYGINRTPTGWWLWAFNNRGVTKYADDWEKIDPNAKSGIRVTPKTIAAKRVRELMTGTDVPVADGSFRFTIPAGDLAIFEITE